MTTFLDFQPYEFRPRFSDENPSATAGPVAPNAGTGNTTNVGMSRPFWSVRVRLAQNADDLVDMDFMGQGANDLFHRTAFIAPDASLDKFFVGFVGGFSATQDVGNIVVDVIQIDEFGQQLALYPEQSFSGEVPIYTFYDVLPVAPMKAGLPVVMRVQVRAYSEASGVALPSMYAAIFMR